MKPFSGTTALGLVLCSAGLATLWAGAAHTGSPDQFLDLITGIVALGAGGAAIGAAEGWFEPTAKTAAPSFYYGAGALVCVCLCMFVWFFGMRQVGGFDYSALIDPPWRACHGQTPYEDFPLTFPVYFVIGSKLAFKWFGVYWSSITALNALFAVITFWWSLWLLTELHGRRWTNLLWAATLQSLTTALTAFWWYSTITTVGCVLYLLSAVLWLQRPASLPAIATYFLSLLLAAGMKPNSSGPLILLVSGILFFSRPHRLKILALSAAAFAAFYGILWCEGIGLAAMIKNYLGVSGRLLSLGHFLAPGFTDVSEYALYTLAGLAALVPVFPTLWHAIFKNRALLSNKRTVIGLTAFAVGFFGYLTNSAHYCDICVMLFAAGFFVAELPRPTWTRYVLMVSMVVAAGGIACGASRYNVKSSGIPMFFEYDGNRHTIDSGFFKGLHCGEVMFETLKEEAGVVANGGTIWFGPSMAWGYAAFNQPSPKGQPIFWEPGTAFAAKDEEAYFNKFMDCHYETLILFKNCFSKYSQDKLSRLGAAYDVDQSLQALTILRLKK